MQDGTDYKDALAGVGFSWRARRATTLGVHARGGSGNVSLARADVGAEAVRYSGAFEAGGGVRWLSFEGTDMLALSPQLTWDDGDRWRLAGRYTYSRSWFDRTRESRSDHSASLRWTWQGSRRVALQAGYAYGIPSFEYLTSDRVAALGIHTASAGLRLDLPWLMRVTTTWEHEWRSNDATVDRLTLSLVQLIP
jgi:hypothetical protein